MNPGLILKTPASNVTNAEMDAKKWEKKSTSCFPVLIKVLAHPQNGTYFSCSSGFMCPCNSGIRGWILSDKNLKPLSLEELSLFLRKDLLHNLTESRRSSRISSFGWPLRQNFIGEETFNSNIFTRDTNILKGKYSQLFKYYWLNYRHLCTNSTFLHFFIFYF